MNPGILDAAGGLGLFLLGMLVMTDGLRALAGDALRRTLTSFTRSPLSGALTGAATTAIVQSSSATTVAAVGFVGAGLLSFPQAVGIVFGANVGTTITGWIVALVGFKLELGQLALPLILAGVSMRLLGRSKLEAIGFALAGFGLIFVGIDLLQSGMLQFEGTWTPEHYPADTVPGRLLLVLLGIAITIVTQSSSAGVASALAALHIGTISLTQAAAMVIGMDIGTTFSAVLATVGGSTDARRTGFAHVIYNVLTGVGAFVLLTPYVGFMTSRSASGIPSDPELILVGFHTLFNVLGVVVMLPFADLFARLIVRLIPERELPFTSRLDGSLLRDPDVAIRALAATLGDIAQKTLAVFLDLLQTPSESATERLALLELAIAECRRYVERMRTASDQGRTYQRHLSAMHAIDHLDRLVERCKETRCAATVERDRELADLAQELRATVEAAMPALSAPAEEPEEAAPERAWRTLEAASEPFRRDTLHTTAIGSFDSRQAEARLDAIRWLHRIAYHVWRVVHHLRRCHFDRDLDAPEVMERKAEHPD